MPIYDYVCSNCGHLTEVVHGINDPGPKFCPECGAEGTMTKAFAPPTIHFKGTGWAKKDRSSSSSGSSRSSSSSKKDDNAKSGSSGDSGSSSSSELGRVVGERRRAASERLVGGRLVGQRLGAGRIDERLMAPTAADWITLAEASEILEAANIRFRPETIGAWARAGKLQSIKLGGRRFVRRGEVKALVAGPRRVRADDLQPALFEELQR